MIAGLLAKLAADRRGVTIVEFALVAPTLLVLLLGAFDLGINAYTTEQLQGAIQAAARNSSIEGSSGRVAAIDGIVSRAVKTISPAATLTFNRTAYSAFTNVSRPENFTDINANGVCDAGEPYEDLNANNLWDRNGGAGGFGQARDAVLYSVTVKFPRAFPIAALIPGLSPQMVLTSNNVLRNQPYAANSNSAPPVHYCP